MTTSIEILVSAVQNATPNTPEGVAVALRANPLYTKGVVSGIRRFLRTQGTKGAALMAALDAAPSVPLGGVLDGMMTGTTTPATPTPAAMAAAMAASKKATKKAKAVAPDERGAAAAHATLKAARLQLAAQHLSSNGARLNPARNSNRAARAIANRAARARFAGSGSYQEAFNASLAAQGFEPHYA